MDARGIIRMNDIFVSRKALIMYSTVSLIIQDYIRPYVDIFIATFLLRTLYRPELFLSN